MCKPARRQAGARQDGTADATTPVTVPLQRSPETRISSHCTGNGLADLAH